MVFSDGLTKAQRLVELQHLFWRNSGRPLASAEIARRLGIHPRTVRKYLAELSATGRLPITRVRRAWRLADGARLEVLPVRFLLEEATAVYLAARLLNRTADEPNPAVGAALAKLASVVPAELRAFVDRLADRAMGAQGGQFAEVFRTLAYGWALSRVVELHYAARSRPPAAPITCRFEVHLLEPSSVGSALYAIGRADPPGELRTFKLERILAATLTRDTFTPPPPEQALARLDTAWGVWLSHDPPVTVRLRFAPAAAARVRETRWHSSQRLQELDSGLELTLTVSSTVELRPWILGWGSLCEVVEPEELRADIAAELARAAAAYQAARP